VLNSEKVCNLIEVSSLANPHPQNRQDSSIRLGQFAYSFVPKNVGVLLHPNFQVCSRIVLSHYWAYRFRALVWHIPSFRQIDSFSPWSFVCTHSFPKAHIPLRVESHGHLVFLVLPEAFATISAKSRELAISSKERYKTSTRIDQK